MASPKWNDLVRASNRVVDILDPISGIGIGLDGVCAQEFPDAKTIISAARDVIAERGVLSIKNWDEIAFAEIT